MSTDTAKLIALGKRSYSLETRELAAALEAAEAEKHAAHANLDDAWREVEALHDALEAAEAQRDEATQGGILWADRARVLAAGLRVIASGEYASGAEDFAAGVLAAVEMLEDQP